VLNIGHGVSRLGSSSVFRQQLSETYSFLLSVPLCVLTQVAYSSTYTTKVEHGSGLVVLLLFCCYLESDWRFVAVRDVDN